MYLWTIGNGVEFFNPDPNDFTGKLGYYYINTGETYNPTIMYSMRSHQYYVGDWGSLAELYLDDECDDLYDLEYAED